LSGRALIDFTAAAAGGGALRLAFERPVTVLCARAAHEVRGVLRAAEQHARGGHWCVGYLRYEAAAAFDPACETHAPDGPLAWFAVYDEATAWPALSLERHAPMQWHSSETEARFTDAVQRLHQAITDGEVYQVNHTARLHSRFDGDPLGLFHALHRAQPQAYAAFIDSGHEQVLSVSPELFFDWREGRLLARPMKGTAARGATDEADAAQAEGLVRSEKERAENLMIVDLIRNDLSRVAEPFSVQVPRLFECRAWPTVWQMTSDVTARSRPGTTLDEVFAALFPCGSVTGAPKLRAMHWVRRLEPEPRGVYCGAVGVLQPGGAATFNVPIRTVVLRKGRAQCGIGSGITIDAQAPAEWQEWQHKRGFLERASQPFELLQTLRLEQGVLGSAELHLQRMAAAARHFGYRFDQSAAMQRLQAVAQQQPAGRWRVRLRSDASGRIEADVFALDNPVAAPVTVCLAAQPVQAPLEFLRHKTTRRGHYEALAPRGPEVFDSLLWNDRGELTEFTRGSVVAELSDGRLVTPPLACGLLDGVGRALALQRGVQEAVLHVEALAQVRRLWFVNALRGWLPVQLPVRAAEAPLSASQG